uniref:Metalloendopeptidase n=1 Tax=Strongyloides venezuelensis TaxID=75913 RepID=A0A0K0FQT1_STRVS
MNTTIPYAIQKTLQYADKIKYYHDLFEEKTCIKFIKSDCESVLFNRTHIKWGHNCSVSANVVGRYIVYSINVNEKCNGRDRFLKLIYWTTKLRYQFAKYFKNTSGYQPEHFKEDTMQAILDKYNCTIDTLGEAEIKIDRFELAISIPQSPKKDDVDPNDLEQRDYNKELSIYDLSWLNKRICSSSCTDKESSRFKCSNGGLKNPKTCNACVCPFFYTGNNCKNYMKPKEGSCGKSLLKASSSEKTQVLDFNKECYYRIEPTLTRSKKTQVKLTPINGSTDWYCYRRKILEVKYKKDKSRDGVIPCGKMIEFTVTSDKGTSVFIYQDTTVQELKIKMKYKSI